MPLHQFQNSESPWISNQANYRKWPVQWTNWYSSCR